MENWGLVTYRETNLLYKKGVSSPADQQRIATVVAHELAHMVGGRSLLGILINFIWVLASCLIYARALLEYVIIIVWARSVNKMLPSVKFAKDKVLTFLILREKC